MTILHWQIVPKEPPKIIKRCPRCNHSFFVCSEKFRMNSNKKSTDIWLIYRCEECAYTWNMDIVTRKTSREIDNEIFDKCEKNDVDLAWKYAFDKEVLAKNKVRTDSSIEVEVIGNIDQLYLNIPSCHLKLDTKYYLEIPIKKILRTTFKMSISVFEKIISEKIIEVVSPENSDLSSKLGQGCLLNINVTQLKNICLQQTSLTD